MFVKLGEIWFNVAHIVKVEAYRTAPASDLVYLVTFAGNHQQARGITAEEFKRLMNVTGTAGARK